MAISAQARKILWARSGNQCARCQVPLITPDDTSEGSRAVVGEECHIIARNLSGPRGREGSRDDLDAYENLILLCANCHSVVDAQPQSFFRERLLQMKDEHEQRFARPGPVPPLTLTYEDRLADLVFRHIDSGELLVDALAGCGSYTHGTPPRLSSSQRALLGDFLQDAADFVDIHDWIGPKGQFEAADRLQDYLDELRQEGLVIYIAHRRMKASGGAGPSAHWRHIAIYAVHEENVRADAHAPVAA